MSRRLLSIDLVRGLAIIAMIQAHLWEYYIAAPEGLGAALADWLVGPLSGYAAPLFTLISGVGAGLACLNGPPPAPRPFLVRGLLLFGLASAVSLGSSVLLGGGAGGWLNWGVIQLVGACLCLAPLFARLPAGLRPLLALLPLAAVELLPAAALPPALALGFAPPWPWATLYFVGMLVGAHYLHHTLPAGAGGWRRLGLAGLAGLALGGLLHLRYRPFVVQHSERPDLTAMVLYLGLLLILLAICGAACDGSYSPGRLANALSGLGQRALTIYYLQLVGLVAGALLLRRFTGQAVGLNWGWFPALVVGVLAALHLSINLIWARYNYWLSLEWALARVVGLRAAPASKES